MLHLNCAICADLLKPADDVHSTNCGHMFHNDCLQQWLQRSRTCPQCRNICMKRDTFRLYFNLANLDTSRIDAGTIQEQLDNANLQLQLKETELKKKNEENDTMKKSLTHSRMIISCLEKKVEKDNFAMKTYAEQLKLLRLHIKMTEDLRNEVQSLKDDIAKMNTLKVILNASTADAEAMLKNEKDPKTLCILATTLKKELRLCQSKKSELHTSLKRSQNELHKNHQEKRELLERIAQLESENYQLNEKLQNDAKKSTGTLTAMEMPEGTLTCHLNDLNKSSKRSTISPTIKENVKKIEESDSPYLNVKSSSIGLISLFNRQLDPSTAKKYKPNSTSPKKTHIMQVLKKSNSDFSEKYSIFNKPRFSTLTSQTMKPLPSNVVFNGFGGTERMDPFAARQYANAEIPLTEKLPTNQGKQPQTLKKLHPFADLHLKDSEIIFDQLPRRKMKPSQNTTDQDLLNLTFKKVHPVDDVVEIE